MKKEIVAAVSGRIVNTFANALTDVAPKICEMLETQAEENENDDIQKSSAQITITPKILIQFTAPGCFAIEVRVPAKRIVSVCGEDNTELAVDENGVVEDLNQELPGMTEE